MRKIGIMGGTFNPIHYGHLFLAENAYEQIGLEKILFMPTKNPPHKAKPVKVTDQQRGEMVSLAIKDNPHFELSTMELEREGTTYTADTLTILTRKNPEIDYHFIIGADSLFELQNWKYPEIIFKLCTIIAANRDQSEKELLYKQINYLESNFGAKILLIDMPTIQISSATIRERIISDKTVRYYLPDAVNDYIMKYRLYATVPEVR